MAKFLLGEVCARDGGRDGIVEGVEVREKVWVVCDVERGLGRVCLQEERDCLVQYTLADEAPLISQIWAFRDVERGSTVQVKSETTSMLITAMSADGLDMDGRQGSCSPGRLI